MRCAFAVLGCILAIGWSPLHAQSEKEKAKDAKKPSAAQQQRKADDQRRRVHKPPPHDPTHPQDQRARERTAGDPPPDHRGHIVSKDSQPPKGPPSKAQQMQQQQYDQRRAQSGELPPDANQVVQCRARPVCGGGYGFCQGVMQTYSAANLHSSRRDIVRLCQEANTPDSCSCAPQCDLVAQCSIF